MRRIAGMMAAGMALLAQGCFEIEGDLADPYIKPADMAAPLRSGFYQTCFVPRNATPECIKAEVRKKDVGYDIIEYTAALDENEQARFDAARAAVLERPQGKYVFKRLEIPAEHLADLTPAEAEVASVPLFLVAERSIVDGELQDIRYGLARYDAEGYWEMWQPKCEDLPVGALATWVRMGWLASPREKLASFRDETCTFRREGLDDSRLRLILSRGGTGLVQRLYWRGETDPDTRSEGDEQ